ncbi:MAG TPA: tetratricopeptide repeat-containing glycosyltransferase family protein [Acetobacteraceae bacterium]|jgi:tetratricopeptide (TPR) repeat protein|nr:tetratricopeptide repeat-containing glycosyltransferase family protein [Acetobacteraceae bacterium]
MSAASSPRTVGDTLNEATALHQQDRFAEAEAVYRGLLRRHPRTPDAMLRLGLLLAQLDRHEEAAAQFAAAAVLAPAAALPWAQLAATQQRLGRFAEAVVSYDRLLALQPDDVGAHANRGAALLRLSRAAEALASCDAALARQPALAEVHSNRGNALLLLGRRADAVAAYDQALTLNSALAVTAMNRGGALEQLGRLAEALESYDKAIRLDPDLVQAHYNRGNLLQAMDRPAEAVGAFDTALARNPTHAAAACNRATALRALGQLDAAAAGYDAALARDPTMVQALVNRGSLMVMHGQHAEALAMYDKAKAIFAYSADAHWNEALCRLAMGDFAGGWRGHEWRWRTDPLRLAERVYPQPLWLGETSLAGRTIFAYGEQGHGDVLQFCRLVPTLSDLGADVVLEVPYAMARLIRTMPGRQRVIGHNEPPPAFDLHCPLMSLPLALGLTLETIPATTPYLSADPDQARAWAIRLASLPGLRVGLVWAGNPRANDPAANAIDRRRSMPLAKLAPLGAVPGVSFVSLQKGPPAEQARTPPPGFALTDWTEELWDFADTAAVIAGLDLVISVDTSVVHLAGALGKPVWVLNRYDACWRWLHGRTDSPWYPTARLFRQRVYGEWDGVIEQVVTALRELVVAPQGSIAA